MNKLIVVSGGTKGIGKAILNVFCSEGFDAVTCSRNKSDLAALKKELEEKWKGVTLHTFEADLSVKEELQEFAAFVKKNAGTPDVLVNNTGVFIPGQVLEEEEGVLEQIIETNLYSAYRLTRRFAADMVARGKGHIFNMCSIASITAYPNGGSYSISKFAMLGMSKVLREELKEKGIKVTAILPGATLTASWEGVDIPPERFMKSEDVAEATWSAYQMSKRSVVEEIVIRPQAGDL
jgi:short-subunit dehydrogenase